MAELWPFDFEVRAKSGVLAHFGQIIGHFGHISYGMDFKFVLPIKFGLPIKICLPININANDRPYQLSFALILMGKPI